MVKDKKEESLEVTISQIEKQFGKGAIMKLGSKGRIEKTEVIPTGSLSLDIALGVGGIPKGRVTEIFGSEGGGKTTLSLQIIANAQRLKGTAAFVDAEHSMDLNYAKRLGVDVENLLVSQPDTGEQALEIVEALVRSNLVDIVVIDSVSALVPRAEIEGEMGDVHMGLQARLMSQALRKLTACISKSKTCVIFINQIRMKIGVIFGNPETTSGGRALKFYSSVRLDIRRIGAVKVADIHIGNRIRVKVAKNKVAPPFRQVECDMIFGKGISKEGCILDVALENDLIKKKGSWFSYKDNEIGQGKENVKIYLKENPKVAQEIEDILRKKLLSL